MKSIAYIPASNQAANASQMTVQTVRSPGATDILVNTVTGAPAKFYGSMGAPHTFTDPVTSETITIISEATAVDFAGHLDSGKVVIDAIAPGYVDTRGSLVGDIVVIRPVTEWANNIFNILSQSHNDDGSIKDSAVVYNPNVFDYVASGAIITGLNYGSTLTASLSAGVVYINGSRQTINAIASRSYTPSKDTYIDLLYNSSGIATVVYTEVANNAVSPVLAANSVRLAIVITGASSIADAGSINQGQVDKLLPIISSVAFTVVDWIGNLINPRDPKRALLGYRQYASNQSGIAGSLIDLTGMVATVKVPDSRRIRIKGTVSNSNSTVNGDKVQLRIYEGATQLNGGQLVMNNLGQTMIVEQLLSPTAGDHTYKLAAIRSNGTGSFATNADAFNLVILTIELV